MEEIKYMLCSASHKMATSCPTIREVLNELLKDSGAFNHCKSLSEAYTACEQLAKAVGVDVRCDVLSFSDHRPQDPICAPLIVDEEKYPTAYYFARGVSVRWMVKHGHAHLKQIWLQEVNGSNEIRNLLQEASSRGDERMVQMLLEGGADVNANWWGDALELGASNGHEKVVQVLLDFRIEAVIGGRGSQAFRTAVSRGHEKVVQVLLNAGVRLFDEHKVLEAAAADGKEQVVQVFMDFGIDGGNNFASALRAASSAGHEKVVQVLMKAGLDIDAPEAALEAASLEGREHIVQMLLAAMASIDSQRGCGGALRMASGNGHAGVLQILVGAGADVQAKEEKHGNALHAASSRGHKEIVQMLLDAGADVNTRMGRYGSALHLASERGHAKVVRILICAGADINAQEHSLGSPLQAASSRGCEEVVQMLLAAGADVNPPGRDFYGTALQAASRGGYATVVRMLLQAGAHVNVDGGLCDSALKAAMAWSGESKDQVVEMLLHAGARPIDDRPWKKRKV